MILEGLVIADEPDVWRGLGFSLGDDAFAVGGVTLRLAGRRAGEGILGWSVRGLDSSVLPHAPTPGVHPVGHPNGVTAVDHVVALTGEFDTTVAALAADGLRARRVREMPDGRGRQAFYVLGTALLELSGPAPEEARPRFWGLTMVASDLDGLAERLGDRLGPVHDAVQPGRRIAALRRSAGLALPLAFMTSR